MFTKRQDIRCIHFHVIICDLYQHRIPLISQPVNFTKMHVNVIVKENKEKSTVCNENKISLLLAHCHHQGHLYLTTDTKFVSVISVLSPGSWSKIGVLARPFFHKMFNFQFIFLNKKRIWNA